MRDIGKVDYMEKVYPRRENCAVISVCIFLPCRFFRQGFFYEVFMILHFKNCKKYENGKLIDLNGNLSINGEGEKFFENCIVLPSFCDVHVHFRQPGFEYKETIETGSKAAARGGYTEVCTMPNLNPAPHSLENLELQLNAIKESSLINVHPFGTITENQKGNTLSEMEKMAPFVCGFSDDGKGVQNREIMEAAMQKAKALNKVISAHCEDESLLFGGVIHKGEYAKEHSIPGICSESEWGPVKRDIELIKKTGCKYHVCHISAKETVEIIRQAKKEGVNITCETGPHYLVLDDSDLKDEGRFKMNPPLRAKEDRLALIDGIKDGTIDMIATDHAPHSKEEKSKGLLKSAMGIVGLETAFPMLYTKLVKENIITLEKLTELMAINPRRRFDFEDTKDITVWDLNQSYKITPQEFLSKGKATPFEGMEVWGKCLLTVCNNNAVYED